MVEMNQISDELLTAFLEGKTNGDETVRVLNAIASNSDLAELVNDAYVMDEIDRILEIEGDDGYFNFGIEPVFSDEKKSDGVERFLLPDDSLIQDMLPMAALKGRK